MTSAVLAVHLDFLVIELDSLYSFVSDWRWMFMLRTQFFGSVQTAAAVVAAGNVIAVTLCLRVFLFKYLEI